MRRAVLVGALLAGSAAAQAHGVGARLLGPGAQTVEFHYAGGEPMAYAAVRLFAPGDAVPFVDGRADRLGRFAFLPDTPGPWTIRAEDGDGHKAELTVDAAAGGTAVASPGGLFTPWRIALWASLAFNILCAARWLGRRFPGATLDRSA